MVAHRAGEAGAVLVRAAEVIEGREIVAERRGRSSDLANGPGRLGQALALDGSFDGVDLREGSLRLVAPEGPVGPIANGARVGISKAIDFPWRFWLEGSEHVSKGRPGPAPRKRRKP